MYPRVIVLLVFFFHPFFMAVRAEEQVEKRYDVHGEVIDSEGVPAPHVQIELFSLSPAIGLKGQDRKLNDFVTDGSGHFQIEGVTSEPFGFLRVTPPQGPVVSRGIFLGMGRGDGSTPLVKLHLSKFQAAQFQVVDHSGKPISQARIHRLTGESLNLGPLSRSLPSAGLLIGKTDDAGMLSDFVEMERAQFVWVEKEGYLMQSIAISPPQNGLQGMIGSGQIRIDERPVGQDAPYRIVLQPARTISGRVIDPVSGLAVANANVALEMVLGRGRESLTQGSCVPLGMSISTNSQGEFSDSSFPAVPMRVFVSQNGRMAGLEVPDSPTEGSINLGDITLGDGVEVTGQLYDVDLEAPPQIDDGHVAVRNFTGLQFTNRIEHDGSFKVRVPQYFQGTPYLLAHRDWTEQSSSKSPIAPGSSAVLKVVKRPPVLTDAEVLTELPKFPEEYRLKEGQLIKRFDRPFSRAREAFFQSARLSGLNPPQGLVAVPRGHLRRSGSDHVTSPNGAVFVMDNQNRIRVGISTHGRLTVGEILMSVYPNMGYDRIRSPNSHSKGEPTLGDFVVRENAPISELALAINEAFEEHRPIPFHLTVHEESYLTGIVKNRPSRETFAEPMKLELIPDGYDGPTETISHRSTWGHLVDQVVEHRLGLHWKLECEDTSEEATLVVTYPRLMNQTGNSNRQQLQDAARARENLYSQLQAIAPAAFKASLGVDLEIRNIPLPVVIIE